MIKKAGLLMLLFIASISFVCAQLDITLTKSSYYAGETLQADIQGGFIDNLLEENINIYSADGVHASPAESGLIKTEGKYLYYAVLPETAGKYNLTIENTKYYSGTQQVSDMVVKNFEITLTNSSYLSVKPGFIYTTSEKDLALDIQAFNANQEVKVSFSEAGFSQTFTLGYNSKKRIYIPIANLSETVKSKISINSYSIPVTIFALNKTLENETIVQELADMLKTNPREINATILKDSDYTLQLYLNTYDGQEVSNISIKTSGSEIKASSSFIDSMSNTKIINITISSDKDFEGYINLSITNSSIEIPVNIKITTDPSEVNMINPPDNSPKTCEELKGAYCSSEQSCDQITYDKFGGPCCTSGCKNPSGSSSWIWGLIIIAVLIIGGYLLYKKYKQDPNFQKKTNELFKRKSENYNERMNPQPVEVRKSLSKL